ncbi:MAG: hypothetical protein KDC52_19860, partial [Ignavibacteriae bacterium]|nr:hypothetical protein [Ignavibacteriota bacterium]
MHDSKGKIWITSDKGLFCYHKKDKKFEQFTKQNSNISDDVTISIYEDNSGFIWVGTRSGGVNKLDKKSKTFKNYYYRNNDTTTITSNYVVSLNGDDKYIWAGTLNGLSRINRITGQIKQITEKDGLDDDCINGILLDKSNDLWMSTNYGITHYNPNENIFRNYDKSDRLQDNKFKGLSYFKSNSGVMYFGGTNGFNSFIPEKVIDNKNIPPIVLTSFKVLYKEKILEHELTLINFVELEYFENDLQFEFSALDYTAPQKNLYQFKLEGFNSDWTPPSNQRSANYTNLDPGEYTFRAIGSNNDNYWNRDGIAVKIKIKTPYWNTWWFRTLIGLSIALIIITMFNFRVRGIKSQRKKLEELNEKLSAEIDEKKKTEVQLVSARDKAEQADKLKSEFLAQISHEIRSPINIISNYVSLIKEELSEKKNDVIDDSFNAIDKANNRIIRSIDLIINMSELQLGIYEPSYDKLNLVNDIFDDIVLQYKHSAKKKNIKITFNSDLKNPV